MFLKYFQKKFFTGSVHFYIQNLPPIILDSDLILGLPTQNTKKLHRQVLKEEVTNRFGNGYSHGAPDSDICHIAKFYKEPFTGQANKEWDSAGVGLLANHIRLPLWH